MYNGEDMNDPREEAIGAAYDAARFDERTPDEAGFAARFEGLKPAIVSNLGFNLRVNDERKRRRKIGKIVAVLVAVLFFPAIVLLNASDKNMASVTLYLVIFIWIMIWIWAFKKRPGDEDPNHAAAIEAVLEQFACRIGRNVAPHHPQLDEPPVFPEHTKFDMQSEHILGTFDGHMEFAAVRVVTEKKEGKSSRETFRGWYLRVDLPFAFKGTTIIRERLGLGNMRSASRLEGLQNVELEDPAFRARYSVMSTDQVEARVILPPDVIQHLAQAKTDPLSLNNLTLAFDSGYAYLWLPSRATALSDWRPLDPTRLIEDLHEAFAELASMRAFLRDIDVIAESEGFRAQAAKNVR